MTTSVLFVCMGNICRSPTAEGVFIKLVQEAGLEREFKIDSAGLSDGHRGEPPDKRAQTTASAKGYDLSKLRSRPVTREDFAKFDYILPMDTSNLTVLQSIKPADYAGKLQLFLDFASPESGYQGKDVPDPYYGGKAGFERVLTMSEDAAAGLLKALRG